MYYIHVFSTCINILYIGIFVNEANWNCLYAYKIIWSTQYIRVKFTNIYLYIYIYIYNSLVLTQTEYAALVINTLDFVFLFPIFLQDMLMHWVFFYG